MTALTSAPHYLAEGQLPALGGKSPKPTVLFGKAVSPSNLRNCMAKGDKMADLFGISCLFGQMR